MVTITKKHTPYNYTKSNTGRKYIVLHYTGNNTDTAAANANYFASGYRGASAHYFVDKTSIFEVVAPENTAWAVGVNFGKNNLYGKCTNGNSISIEMCSDGGRISDKTFQNAVDLTKYLMDKYGIPASNVVRHWDVCTKKCPAWSGWIPPYEALWEKFKKAVSYKEAQEETPEPPKNVDMRRFDTMWCTYTIDGKSAVYWFDGQKIHKLGHPDELQVIRNIYRANTGQELPNFKWTSKAPWYMRLENALKS